MAREQFYTRIDGERVAIELASLADYEAEGGIYFDGEQFATVATTEIDGPIWHEDGDINTRWLDLARERARRQFVAALSIDVGASSFNVGDEWRILASEDLAEADVWYDSVANCYLIRDWPENAPYPVRAKVGANAAGWGS